MQLLAVGVLLSAAASFAQPGSAPAFEVASVKISTDLPGHSGWDTDPGSLRVRNMTLRQCISTAYGAVHFEISGGPKWLDSERFNIVARAAGPADDDHLLLMLQTLMADRFQLACHRETRLAQGYAMVLAKGGLKIKPNESHGDSTTQTGRNSLTAVNMSFEALAEMLASRLGTPVLDATGVRGSFDFTLKWTPDENRPSMAGAENQPSSGQNLATATGLPEVLQEQLGLKLEPRKVSVQVLVIDRAAKPSEN